MLANDLVAEQKRKGLRVALAVSVGFTASVASGQIVPFLGPLFAAQFLLSSSLPIPFGKTLGMCGLILVVGVAVSYLPAWFGDDPATFVALLSLLYFLCFVTQTQGKYGAAVFLILIVDVIVPLIGKLNEELAESTLSILVTGVVTGAALMWLAHAVVPEPTVAEIPSEITITTKPDYLRALSNTVILISTMVFCLINESFSSALLIPITVVSVLGQIDITATSRATIDLIIVNVLGGVLASIGYAILSLRPNLFWMFIIVLVVGLLIGGRAAARSATAKVHAGALTIFLSLFGIGVSPLPGSSAESFSTRILLVVVAIGYVVLTTALLWRSRPRSHRSP